MEINIFDMGIVLAIVVIAYLFGLLAKLCKKIPNEAIPVIVGFVGGVMGAIGMYVMPDFPATDIISAIAVGIVSGLASTGVDQAVKQLRGLKACDK